MRARADFARPGKRLVRAVQRHLRPAAMGLPRLTSMTRRPLLCLLVCLPLAGSAAEVYSWSDGNGVRHFTQEAPPKGVQFKRIPVESTSPSPSSAPSSRPASGSTETKKDSVMGGGPKTREAGLRLRAETLERCAKARERIAFLEEKTARRLFKPGLDGGEPSRYTDEEFNAEMKAAREVEAANCI